MDSGHRKLRQIQSLLRLRELQKTQLAVELAAANERETLAAKGAQQAQARYRLATELQRRQRANGQSIDPVLYGLQLSAADLVKDVFVSKTRHHESTKAEQRQAKQNFADAHAAKRVAEEAVGKMQKAITAAQGKEEALDVLCHGTQESTTR